MIRHTIIKAVVLASMVHMGTAFAATTETRSSNWAFNPGIPNSRFEPYVPPYWELIRAPGEGSQLGTVEVVSDGAPFSFKSIMLYSSISSIPYVFTGLLEGNVAFTWVGELPSPMGSFTKLFNPYAWAPIDTLRISLTNPEQPLCETCGNPMGYSRIALSAVPEPGALTLLGFGLVTALVLGRRQAGRAALARPGTD